MDSLSFDSLDQLCCRHTYRFDNPAYTRVQCVWSDDETDFVLNSIAVIFVVELDDFCPSHGNVVVVEESCSFWLVVERVQMCVKGKRIREGSLEEVQKCK
jgi:hypothetical protein